MIPRHQHLQYRNVLQTNALKGFSLIKIITNKCSVWNGDELWWLLVIEFKKKTVTGINGRQQTTKTLMEWASVKVGSTRCCQGGMKKQTRVKQTKEVLITTPPMHRFIQYFIKGHTFDYEKRFYINAQLIPWLCQTYIFHCSKMFSPITLLMDLRWTLI